MRKLISIVFALLLSSSAVHAACGPHRILCLSGKKTVATTLWNPANDTHVVAWWDAQDSPHITLSGSNVTAWTDRVGGISPVQATGGSQPTFSATARNGKPGLTFSGGQSLMQGGSLGTIPAVNTAITMVVAGFASATPGTWADAFGYGASGAGNLRQMGIFSTNAIAASSTPAGINYVVTESWLNTDRFALLEWSAGNAITGFIDGGSGEVGSTNSPVAVGGNVSIGSNIDGISQPWTGVIQQIVVTNTIATTNERQCLEGWESWYDGKAGSNLPGGHPYKLAPPTVSSSC